MAYFRRSPGHRLNPPKVVTFSISLALVLVAIASLYVHVPVIGPDLAAHRFWIVVVGYVLLAAGCVLRGL